ncbi:MFS transporter [Saccharopolyspora indica]|uniref:MFS transporter n=1 Tax=Saccharopolyspora indica TaxID=1229659 RepID=UPI0022EB9789|nr:MFS transporter [Saccharopolyspora indica]MDA3643980.1 MFS transporter [Saccharopolyspora indica]
MPVREDERRSGRDLRRGAALVVMLAAMAMDLLDVAIVNLALPSIREDLDTSTTATTWIVAGYPLAFGALLVTGGRLGDAFGRKRMFVVGVAGFALTSALCGAAPSGAVLIVGRVLQGVFAALMTPQILSVIQVEFTPSERPKAYAAFGAVQGVSTIGGPILGGLLVDLDLWDLGWRLIFLINLPIGAITVIASVLLLRESRADGEQSFDALGVVLLAAPLVCLLLPLTQAGEHGWSAGTIAILVASLPLFALFARQQSRRDREGGMPLLPPRLFRQRGFAGGFLAGTVFFAGVVGFLMVFAMVMQDGYGYAPREAGLLLIPYSLGIAVSSALSFPLVPRLGRGLIRLGALVKAAGMAALLVAFVLAGDGLSWWHPLPGLLICGIGMGLVAPTVADVALARVRPSDAGAASGGLITAGQIGGATGVAAVGAIFFGLVGAHADHLEAFTGALVFEIVVMLLAAALAGVIPKPSAQDREAAS